MSPSIRVGVFDWANFAASGQYYPEDMPPEWRLSYFANEFETSCISLGTDSVDVESLLECCEDLPAGFELSFQVRSQAHINIVDAFMAQGEINLGYVVYDGQESELFPNNLSIPGRLHSAGIQQTQRIIALPQIWRPGIQSNQVSNLAMVPGEASMRQYREWIEQWLAQAGTHSEMTLWLQGNETRYQTLSECRSLVELMGY